MLLELIFVNAPFWISLEHNIQSGFPWQGVQVFGFQSFVLFCVFRAFLRVSCIYETQRIFSTESGRLYCHIVVSSD